MFPFLVPPTKNASLFLCVVFNKRNRCIFKRPTPTKLFFVNPPTGNFGRGKISPHAFLSPTKYPACNLINDTVGCASEVLSWRTPSSQPNLYHFARLILSSLQSVKLKNRHYREPRRSRLVPCWHIVLCKISKRPFGAQTSPLSKPFFSWLGNRHKAKVAPASFCPPEFNRVPCGQCGFFRIIQRLLVFPCPLGRQWIHGFKCEFFKFFVKSVHDVCVKRYACARWCKLHLVWVEKFAQHRCRDSFGQTGKMSGEDDQ